jgi:hypothetical protein
MMHGYGPSGLPLGGHLYKGNPFGLAGLSVTDYFDGYDLPGVGEKGLEFGFAGLKGEIGHINFLIHSFDLLSYKKTRKEVVEGSLRAQSTT